MPARLLFEGTDLQALLAQVRADHGTTAKIVAVDRVRAAGLAGLFSKQRYELTVELPTAAARPTPDLVPVSPVPVRPVPVGATAVPAGRADHQSFHTLLAAAADAATPQPPGLDPVTCPAGTLLALLEAEEYLPGPVAEPAAGKDPDTFADLISGSARPAADPVRPRNMDAAVDTGAVPAPTVLADSLARLGLPAELCARITGPDSYREIVAALRVAPAAPSVPSRSGDVLVIVGEVGAALTAARAVAVGLALPPSRIMLAAASTAGTGVHPRRRLTGPPHASARGARLRAKSDQPLIVVVDGTDAGQARAIVTAVGATAVWATVDATRKTSDTARRLVDLGRIDALAVYGCAATVDPGTVLQLAVPVALLDGQPATPYAWAAVFCRRLAEVDV